MPHPSRLTSTTDCIIWIREVQFWALLVRRLSICRNRKASGLFIVLELALYQVKVYYLTAKLETSMSTGKLKLNQDESTDQKQMNPLDTGSNIMAKESLRHHLRRRSNMIRDVYGYKRRNDETPIIFVHCFCTTTVPSSIFIGSPSRWLLFNLIVQQRTGHPRV